MIRGLRSRGTTSAHLIFGQHFHAGLELYDKLKAQLGPDFSHDDAVCEVVLDLLRRTWDAEASAPWDSDHPSKNRHTLIRSVVWYLEEFINDPAHTLILANGKPAVELTFKFDSGIPIDAEAILGYINVEPSTYILSGHLDRVAEFAGHNYVLDRKTTTGALTSHFFDQFNPHSQMSLYTIAGQVVFGIAISGVIIDGAQIGVGFTRFGRGFSPRTPAQSDEYLQSLRWWFRLAETYAAAGYWPMNETACHNYGGCPFRRICSKDPGVRETFIRSDFEERPWNPLQER